MGKEGTFEAKLLRPWPGARLTPTACPVVLLMSLEPQKSRAFAVLCPFNLRGRRPLNFFTNWPLLSGVHGTEVLCGGPAVETGLTTVVGLSDRRMPSSHGLSGRCGVPSFPHGSFSSNLLGRIPPDPAPVPVWLALHPQGQTGSSTLTPETDEGPYPGCLFFILKVKNNLVWARLSGATK